MVRRLELERKSSRTTTRVKVISSLKIFQDDCFTYVIITPFIASVPSALTFFLSPGERK